MAVSTEGIAERILVTVDSRGQVDSYEYACETGVDHQVVVGAIKSLESLGDVSEHGPSVFNKLLYLKCSEGLYKNAFL